MIISKIIFTKSVLIRPVSHTKNVNDWNTLNVFMCNRDTSNTMRLDYANINTRSGQT